MKGFLVRGKKPIVKWGMLPDNTFFKGEIPEGFGLGISPSKGYVIVDVDRHGDIDGFESIPEHLKVELTKTLHYATKNNGRHYWFKYTGTKKLANKTSGQGIDLRTEKGYVVWYPKTKFEDKFKEIKDSSEEMNSWIEKLFCYKIKK